MSDAHPNPWRLSKLLEKSSDTIEEMARTFGSEEFTRFPNAALLARALSEQAQHNRRAIREEFPVMPKLVEMLDREAN